jgi:YD repeat-containing protein
MYSYTSGGLPVKKRMDLYRSVNTLTMDSAYTYDNEGKMTGITYPWGSPKGVHLRCDGTFAVVRGGVGLGDVRVGRAVQRGRATHVAELRHRDESVGGERERAAAVHRNAPM